MKCSCCCCRQWWLVWHVNIYLYCLRWLYVSNGLKMGHYIVVMLFHLNTTRTPAKGAIQFFSLREPSCENWRRHLVRADKSLISHFCTQRNYWEKMCTITTTYHDDRPLPCLALDDMSNCCSHLSTSANINGTWLKCYITVQSKQVPKLRNRPLWRPMSCDHANRGTKPKPEISMLTAMGRWN